MLKKILLFLLLKGRKEYFDIVQTKRKKYKISISQFVPADEWIEEMEKALREAEPKG